MPAARSKILVIDDDEVVLATTQALLQSFGYEAATHVGAFGASSAVTEMRPDLVLLDVNMPGLSGPGLVQLIRKWSKDLRILFYSSSEDDVLQASVNETGADGYVRKGDRSELKQAIASALG